MPAVDHAGQDQGQTAATVHLLLQLAGVDSAPSARKKSHWPRQMESFDLDHTTPDPGVVRERLSNRLPFVDEPLGPVLYWCLAFEGVRSGFSAVWPPRGQHWCVPVHQRLVYDADIFRCSWIKGCSI